MLLMRNIAETKERKRKMLKLKQLCRSIRALTLLQDIKESRNQVGILICQTPP